MSAPILENEARELRREKRDVGGRLLTRVYRIGMADTLAALNLEEGDPLPDNANATIVISDIQPLSDKDRKAGYGGQIAHVVGWLARTYQGYDSRSGFVELSRTRGLIQEGEYRWQAERIWKGPNSTASAFARVSWDNVYPELSGPFAPRVRKSIVRRDVWPGFSSVRCLYKTVREVNKARILIKTKFFQGEKILMDLDGKTVQDIDRHLGKDSTPERPVGDGVHGWQVVRGDDVQMTPYCIVIAQTAAYANNFQMQDVLNCYNTVNDRVLPNFGNAQPETMRCLGANVNWEYGERLLYIDYFFQWSGNRWNWNELLRVQKGLWIIRNDKRFNLAPATGKLTEGEEPTKPVLLFVPGMERYVEGETYKTRPVTATEARRIFKKKDFSVLDSMISWLT